MLTRIITGIVGMAAAVAIITVGDWVFAAAVWLLAMLGWHEFHKMAAEKGFCVYYLTSGLGAVSLVGVAAAGYVSRVDSAFVLIFLTMLTTLFFIFNALEGLFRHCKCGDENWMANVSLSIWGLVYSGLFAYVIILRGYASEFELLNVDLGFTVMERGEALLWLVLLGTWASDTFAYFFGRAFGKRPFCSVSPKKSLEGAAAGFLGCILVVVLLAVNILHIAIWQAAVLALGIAIFAPLGDLIESVLKRSFNIKDSGKVFPGHGGVLDRFDSLLFAAPVTYYLIVILGI